jgi:outer membrane biosynthesis protein TonB
MPVPFLTRDTGWDSWGFVSFFSACKTAHPPHLSNGAERPGTYTIEEQIMKLVRKTTRVMPAALILALLAIFMLAIPVFAEGDAPSDEPPAAESQDQATSEEPASEPAAPPADETPATPAEENADAPPAEDPVPAEQAESEAPQIEEPEAPAATEAPVETVQESSTPDAEQESGGDEVTAQYTGLTDNVYFYNTSNEAQWFSSIAAAITAFDGTGKGMIYVSDNGSAYSEALTVNAVANLSGIVFLDYYPSEAAKYGAEAADTFNPYNSSSWASINNTVSITDMPTFTLLGFKITAASSDPAVSITNDDGISGTLTLAYLDIQNLSTGSGLRIAAHTGKTSLSHVKANSTGGIGAELGVYDEEPGLQVAINSSIEITNSGFNASGGDGLFIYTTEFTTLNDVTASHNDNHGAFLKSRGALVKNSVFSNNGNASPDSGLYYQQNGTGNLSIENTQFNDNYYMGLWAKAYGNVNLKNVRADGNGTYGASIDTCGLDTTCQNRGSGNVTIASSNFENNGTADAGFGLHVGAKGSITLTSVWASGNGDGDGGVYSGGAALANYRSPGSLVSLADCGFNFNAYTGLVINSDGAITLKDVSASGNTHADNGANLNNQFYTRTSSITLLNSTGRQNNFDNNQLVGANPDTDAGLSILSRGNILVNGTTANDNTGGSGAILSSACENCTGSTTVKYSSFNRNDGIGLEVRTHGSITVTLTDNDISDNGSNGILLLNATSPRSNTVTLDGGNYFNNGGHAIYISSVGAVTVKNVAAGDTQNGANGLYIINSVSADVRSKPGVTVTATRSGWTNTFNGNSGEGIYIYSSGAITLNRSNAENNSGRAASLINNAVGASAAVTVSAGVFNHNCTNTDEAALQILSLGNIVLKNVEASENGDDTHAAGGAYFFNYFDATAKFVSISSSQFNANRGDGLRVYSKGAITLAGVSAENNSGQAAYILNALSGFSGNITINNAVFNHNGSNTTSPALEIRSYGSIMLKNVEACENGDGTHAAGGVLLTNQFEGVIKPVSVSSSQFNGNHADGLTITSRGAVSLTNVNAEGNQGIGADVRNDFDQPQNVTISGGNFNGNQGANAFDGSGLYVSSLGNIMVKNVNASGNAGGVGLKIENNGLNATGNVSVACSRGMCSLDSNGDLGLYITTNGSISLANLAVNQNASGAYLYNLSTPDTLLRNITVSNCAFADNSSDYGLSAISKGSITLKNVDAGGNATDGATLQNQNSPKQAGISLIGSGDWDWYGGNGTSGLTIYTLGKVSVSKVNASDNGTVGLSVINNAAEGIGSVVISNAEFSRNVVAASSEASLSVSTIGSITLTNVWVNDNGDADAGFSASYGAMLSNNSGSNQPGVSLTNVTFNHNNATSQGLRISSYGAITIKNIQANQNRANGVSLFNQFEGSSGAVRILRSGSFTNQVSGNSDAGLAIYSNAAINLAFLDAYGNGSTGISLSNNNADSLGALVQVSNCNSNNNSGIGLSITAEGAVSLSSVTANGNGITGISVNNTSLAGQNVILTRLTAIGNSSDGLYVYTGGNVLARDLFLVSNGAGSYSSGADIQTNSAVTGYGSVTLSGVNLFNGNTMHGLQVTIINLGDLTLSGITAEKNNQSGIKASVANGTVSVSKANLNYNHNHGLDVTANNTVLVNSLYALNNGTEGLAYDGIHIIQNSLTAATTISNSSVHGNHGNGIDVATAGDLSDVILNNNACSGNNTHNVGIPDVFIHIL